MKSIMVQFFTFIILAFMLSTGILAQNTNLYELTKVQDNVVTKRISSYDLSGGNNDRMEHILPGEKKVLFDVEGAGMINHIWITIAPPPEELSRNDIILRMYWDGSEIPSVVSPIGPFF